MLKCLPLIVLISPLIFCSGSLYDQGDAHVLSLLHRLAGDLPTTEFMHSLVKSAPPGSTIVDVGMAHGIESFSAAAMGHNVVGFEANPETASVLIERATRETFIEGSLTVVNAAVGAFEGTATFYIDTENRYGVGSSLKKPGSSSVKAAEVPVVSLDGYFTNVSTIFLLKSDTQGYENGVLRGASGLLKRGQIKFVIIEMAPHLFPDDEDPADVARILSSNGYVCFDIIWHATRQRFPSQSVVNRPNEGGAFLDAMRAIGVADNRRYFTDYICELK